MKAAVSGIALEVPQTGIRDEFLYAEDSARAFVSAVTNDDLSYDRYLIGTDQHATLEEIVDLVSKTVPDTDIQLQEKAQTRRGLAIGTVIHQQTRHGFEPIWAGNHGIPCRKWSNRTSNG
ncbi:hypothetical protein ACFQJ8_18940 [Halocatena marina]|uniref:hypothetical protein n=1 Tax=Halocatena marina TaxID=2934937 RepID=UPI00360FD8F8